MRYNNFLPCLIAVVLFLLVEIVSSGTFTQSSEEMKKLYRRDAQSDPVSTSNSTVDSSRNGAKSGTTDSRHNATEADPLKGNEVKPKSIDLSKPGVLKRAVLVFGSFGLVAIAYFIFYRRRLIKRRNNDAGANNCMDGMQFRYGVLQSDEQLDRMDHSRVPLTADSDEETEEDLELFNRDEKAKSTYYNLSTEESKAAVDDIMSSASGSLLRNDELLLDINTGTSPAVIPVNSEKHQV